MALQIESFEKEIVSPHSLGVGPVKGWSELVKQHTTCETAAAHGPH